MKQTIGIRFSRYGQVLACLYDAEGDTPLTVGESAMVMTERGLNCGQVVWQRPWQEELEQSLRAANAAVQSMGGAESEENGGEEAPAATMPIARRATFTMPVEGESTMMIMPTSTTVEIKCGA